MNQNKLPFYIFLILAALLYFIPLTSHYAGLIALIGGITLSSTSLFYKPQKLNNCRKFILNLSIIFFGFSLNINDVISIGSKGLFVSLISLIIVITSGYLLLHVFKTDKVTSELTTYGTAICGGSAISAVSGVLNPNNMQLALSTATIFILNGVALALFPPLGHLLSMTQEQFGVFCALSIHDVSSVVGAADIYGETALQLATVLKLTRTLWLIPIVLVLSSIYKVEHSKLPIPLFILGFIAASLFSSIVNLPFVTSLSVIGKVLLPIALFMVGYAIKINDIQGLGPKSMIYGLSLWLISIVTGLFLAFHW